MPEASAIISFLRPYLKTAVSPAETITIHLEGGLVQDVTEQDREAFEAEYMKHYGLDLPPSFFMGSYMEPRQNAAWHFWQAARDCFAPKLTERAVKAIVSEAIWDDDSEGRVLSRALEAFRAAGVKFRDEA